MEKSVGSKMRFLISIVFLFAIVVISDSCTKSNDSMAGMGNTSGSGTGAKGGPGANEVWIQDMAFNPSSITISAGTTITWTNKDAVAHTVTSDSGLFDSGTIGSGKTYSRTFDTAGTFSYHCSIHPAMTAKVIVN
jgi:plastocyanin